ncbi:MAG: cytochrome c maturation protein CcmE, partial [Dehalococcoidia bacterium]
MTNLLADRRSRLVLLLLVTTVAITVLTIRAAGASVSYYLTPAEYLAGEAYEGSRVRVAGRVVEDTIVLRAGRPIAF